MTQPDLIEHANTHVMRDASLDAYAALLPHLAAKEWFVLREIYRFLRWSVRADITGGELASFMGVPVTSVRPRVTNLVKRGLLHSGPMRYSRLPNERRCHPVWPVLPYDAVLRAEQQRQARQGAA